MAPIPEKLAITRAAVHRIAEHVLSPARYASVQRIGLQPLPNGLTTPPFGPDQTTVALERDQIVVASTGGRHSSPVTTLRAAGEFVGITPGAPSHVYPPATECALDTPLGLEPDAVTFLGQWWTTGGDALQQLIGALTADQPSPAQLWPEHLDLAISAAEVNYGVSPGDAQIAVPYVYVGPHGGRPGGDAFWNAPFGAARTLDEVSTAGDVLSFFLEGHSRTQHSKLMRST